MNTIAQRIALYTTLGLLLATLGVTVYVWQFWGVLALFWASEYMVRKGTEEQAQAIGVAKFLNMSSAEQNRIKKLHQQAQQEHSNDS
jgi:hypothetical protein